MDDGGSCTGCTIWGERRNSESWMAIHQRSSGKHAGKMDGKLWNKVENHSDWCSNWCAGCRKTSGYSGNGCFTCKWLKAASIFGGCLQWSRAALCHIEGWRTGNSGKQWGLQEQILLCRRWNSPDSSGRSSFNRAAGDWNAWKQVKRLNGLWRRWFCFGAYNGVWPCLEV